MKEKSFYKKVRLGRLLISGKLLRVSSEIFKGMIIK